MTDMNDEDRYVSPCEAGLQLRVRDDEHPVLRAAARAARGHARARLSAGKRLGTAAPQLSTAAIVRQLRGAYGTP